MFFGNNRFRTDSNRFFYRMLTAILNWVRHHNLNGIQVKLRLRLQPICTQHFRTMLEMIRQGIVGVVLCRHVKQAMVSFNRLELVLERVQIGSRGLPGSPRRLNGLFKAHRDFRDYSVVPRGSMAVIGLSI